MTYETPVVQEIGDAKELTRGCLCGNYVDCCGMYRNIGIQF